MQSQPRTREGWGLVQKKKMLSKLYITWLAYGKLEEKPILVLMRLNSTPAGFML